MSTNPYAAAAARIADEERRQHAGAVTLAPETSPAQAAEVVNLANRTGAPVGAVRADPEGARMAVERENLAALPSSVSSWITADPERLATARDDLPALRALSLPLLALPGGDMARRLVPGAVGAVAEGVQDAEVGATFQRATVGQFASLIHTAADTVDQTHQAGPRRLFGLFADIAEREGDPQAAAVLRAAYADPLGVAGMAQDAAGVEREVAADMAETAEAIGGRPTMDKGPWNFIRQAVAYYGNMGVQSLPPMLVALATRRPNVGGGIMGGTSGAESYTDLRAEGLSRTEALPPALATGATEAALGATGLRAATAPGLRSIVAGPAVEAGTEAVTELAQVNIEDQALGRRTPLSEQLLQTLDAAILGAGFGTVERGGSAGFDALSGNWSRQTQAIVAEAERAMASHGQAITEQQHLDAMVDAAAESSLRTRAPEMLSEMVDSVQPGQSVYLPLEVLEAHYGRRTEQAVATLAGPDAYAEAVATGAEVRIPLGRYVAMVEQRTHDVFRDHVRMTPGEAVKPGSDLGEAAQQAMAEALEIESAPEGEPVQAVSDRPAPASAMDADSYGAYLEAREAAAEARQAARLAERARLEERAAKRRAAHEWKETAAEVEAELGAQPVYRAERLLRTGRLPDGQFSEVKPKLDHAAVVAAYGEKVADGLKGLTVKRGGMDPDAAAALLGYDSGARLVHDLSTAIPLRDAVRVETDARLASREIDPDPEAMDDGTDAQARALEVEIQGMERRNGGIRTHAVVMKEVAQRFMATKRVVDIRPEQYRLAEAKAGREAYAAASRADWQAAIAARRRQLQALYMYRAARDARDFATKTGRRLAQLSRTPARKRIGLAGGDYLQQLDALLARFNFARLTGPQMAERKSLADWIKAKAAEGVIVDVPPGIADEAFRVPFKQLKLGELRELRDAVDTIVHAANNANMLRLEDELVARKDVDEAMATSVLSHYKLRQRDSGDPSLGEKATEELLSVRAVTATATDLARELDGFTDNGAVWTNTVRVIREANARANAEIRTAQEAFAALKLKHYTREELRGMKRREFIPEVDASWSKERMLSLALNWGNTGNREAILSQVDRRLTPEQVGVILGRLDSRDWDFIEATWQMIGRHWSDIAATQRRRTGLAPERVPPSPFVVTLPDGRQRAISGGYFPLKYESQSVRELRIADQEAYDDLRTGRFAKAATRNGHTIERVGSGGRTVRLDLGVVLQHEREVIRDLRMGDAVNYAHNALHGPEFAAAVSAAGRAPLVTGLDTWLRDAATGEVGVRRWWERGLRMLRTNFTASVLAIRVDSALLQQTGLLQSTVILGRAPMLDGVRRFYRHPVREYQRVTAASEFMRQRLQTHVEAVQKVMDAEAGTIGAAHSAMLRTSYWMMGKSQATVDVATWIAAERVALERGDAPAQAVAFADDVVSRAQASGDWIDKTAIQRGTLSQNVRQSELVRATTVLQSYMTAKWNAAYERTAKANLRSLQGGMSWAMDMVSLFIVEGMVAAIIRGKWPEDEDDDGYLDDVLAKSAEEGASALLGGLPGLAIASSELRGYDSKGLVAEMWEAVARAWTQIEQGELDAGFRKSQVTLAGMLFGIPSAQINKTLDAIEASGEGKEVSPFEYVSGPDKD